jgi:hypothetical protein
MANLSPSNLDNEKNTYVLVTDGSSQEVAQRVKVTGLGSLVEGLKFDSIVAAYPSSIQETYTYKTGGISGTTVAVITVNYTNATKEFVSNVSKT